MAKPSKRSPERKLQVVLSVMRGEVSVAEAARRLGSLDCGGGSHVRGELVHRVAGDRRRRTPQDRRAVHVSAATPGHRRDHLRSPPQHHVWPRGPGHVSPVGPHRGPLEESPRRTPRGARRTDQGDRGGGDRPLRRLQGRRMRPRPRRGAGGDGSIPHPAPRRPSAHRGALPAPAGAHRLLRPQRRPAVGGASEPAARPPTPHRRRPGNASTPRPEPTAGTNSSAPGRS